MSDVVYIQRKTAPSEECSFLVLRSFLTRLQCEPTSPPPDPLCPCFVPAFIFKIVMMSDTRCSLGETSQPVVDLVGRCSFSAGRSVDTSQSKTRISGGRRFRVAQAGILHCSGVNKSASARFASWQVSTTPGCVAKVVPPDGDVVGQLSKQDKGLSVRRYGDRANSSEDLICWAPLC